MVSVNSEEVSENADAEVVKESGEAERSDVEESRTTWQSVKYYFNRFRYYHYVVADTVDKYLSAACLFILNWYFKLFWGVGSEPPSVLSQEDAS